MKKLLAVIDCQNDFISGTLGTDEAKSKVGDIVNKIEKYKDKKDSRIIFTLDTHDDNYLETSEGINLPVVHCKRGTWGWCLHEDILKAIKPKATQLFEKPTFGSVKLAHHIKKHKYTSVELVGFCTDICLVSNALIIKAFCPEIEIEIDSTCCAGVSVNSHNAALETMRMCQIKVK